MSGLVITREDETRLRDLAYAIAKDIEDPQEVLARLGFTHEDYDELAGTRVFKSMLDQAVSEWQGANNVAKRVKLKAAVNIEQAMPSMYDAMIDPKEPLASRVKVFEIMSRVGGLGNPEPQAIGAGSAFNLTIQLDAGGVGSGGTREIVIGGQVVLPEVVYSESYLLADDPFEELSPSS